MIEIPKEIHEKLKDIGLDRTESQVYFLLLKTGIMGIQDITEQLKLPRSSVHLACENLLTRNVLKLSIIGKRRRFYVENPKDIENFIKHKQNIIDLNRLSILSILPKLNTIFITSQNIEPITIEELKGEDGFVETYYRSLNQPPNSETLRIGGDPSLFVVGRDKLQEYSVKRRKNKIYTNLLLPDYRFSNEELKDAKFKMREVRVLKKELFNPKSQLSIWQDNTALTVWDKGLHSVIIKNKAIADTLKQLYKLAWNQAEKE